MPVIMKIKVDGIPAAVRYIDRLDGKLSDSRPGFKKIRRRYSDMVKEVFKEEGGPYQSGKWPALSPMRQFIRGQYGGKGKAAHPILKWTGALQRAATATAPYMETDTKRTIYSKGYPKGTGYSPEKPTTVAYLLQETKDSMYIGLAGPKAIHNDGGTVGKYTIPRRQFWPFNMQTDNEMVHVWALYLDDIMK